MGSVGKCKYFKRLRKRIASIYGVDGLEYKECEFSENCIDCEKELMELADKVSKRKNSYIYEAKLKEVLENKGINLE